MRYILITMLVIFTMGCAKQYVPYKTMCKDDPILKEVKVKNGTISGKDIQSLIDNHIITWEHIEYLKLKGCK